MTGGTSFVVPTRDGMFNDTNPLRSQSIENVDHVAARTRAARYDPEAMGTRGLSGFVACGVLGGVLVATACASSDESADRFDGSSSSGGSSGLAVTDSGGIGDEVLDGCATDTAKANPLPLDLYVLFDTSGGMIYEASPGVTKMKATSDAMMAFLNDPSSAGIGVALTFFPPHPPGAPYTCAQSSECGATGRCNTKMCPADNGIVFCDTDADCGGVSGSCKEAGKCSNEPTAFCNNIGLACPNNWGTCQSQTSYTCIPKDVCADANYATPVVPFTPLPAAAIPIGTALANKKPFGGTPTSAALANAETQAYSHANANAGHTVAIVLVTDGLPTQCNADIDAIAAVAKVGADAKPPIRTFVIGVFSAAEAANAQSNLDKIAAGGGTNKAFIVGVGGNTTKDFVAAMNEVRGKALPCDYRLPQPDGGIPDYGKVNVRHTSPAGAKTVYPNVKNAAGCASGGGWYFDTEPTGGATPGKIILCPATCTEANSAGGQVDVVLGCQTVVR